MQWTLSKQNLDFNSSLISDFDYWEIKQKKKEGFATFLFSLMPLLLLVVTEQVYLNNILRYALGIWSVHCRYKLL